MTDIVLCLDRLVRYLESRKLKIGQLEGTLFFLDVDSGEAVKQVSSNWLDRQPATELGSLIHQANLAGNVTYCGRYGAEGLNGLNRFLAKHDLGSVSQEIVDQLCGEYHHYCLDYYAQAANLPLQIIA